MKGYLAEIESRVAGIPCVIGVTRYDCYSPASASGQPELCSPACGGVGDWVVLDRRGRPAPWLEKKLTRDDIERIDDEIYDVMEDAC